jgi:hypothetical protein
MPRDFDFSFLLEDTETQPASEPPAPVSLEVEPPSRPTFVVPLSAQMPVEDYFPPPVAPLSREQKADVLLIYEQCVTEARRAELSPAGHTPEVSWVRACEIARVSFLAHQRSLSENGGQNNYAAAVATLEGMRREIVDGKMWGKAMMGDTKAATFVLGAGSRPARNRIEFFDPKTNTAMAMEGEGAPAAAMLMLERLASDRRGAKALSGISGDAVARVLEANFDGEDPTDGVLE